MNKSYLRYTQRSTFGLICSPSNVLFLENDTSNRLAFTTAQESILVWNLRVGHIIRSLKNEPSNSTSTCLVLISSCDSTNNYNSRNKNQIVSGYSNGLIIIWNYQTGEKIMNFHGHVGSVSSLAVNSTNTILASGGTDSNIVLWDIIGNIALCNLHGHRNQVTGLCFYGSNYLISCSKDTFVKIWDIKRQHCVQTLLDHPDSVRCIDISQDQTYLATGCSDSSLRVWTLSFESTNSNIDKKKKKKEKEKEIEYKIATFYKSIKRTVKTSITGLKFNNSNTVLALHGTDKTIELYSIPEFNLCHSKIPFRLSSKIQSLCFNLNRTEAEASNKLSKQSEHILVSLDNNSLFLFEFEITMQNEVEVTLINSIELPGHRTGIHHLSLSSDDSMLLSTSKKMIKIWRVESERCVSSMDILGGSPASCGFFLPGSNYVVLATKSGNIQVYDIGAATCVVNIQAHHGSIGGMVIDEDSNSIFTGGSDHLIKKWDVNRMLTDENQDENQDENENKNKNKRNKCEELSSFDVGEEILCIARSRKQHVAVGLLNSQILVLTRKKSQRDRDDSNQLRQSFSLYGHKLPVLSIDIDTEGVILVSGSADKTIKVWGLDFGDCHHSFSRAHLESVTCVRFMPDTHYFMSSSKDSILKHWDGDAFQEIHSLIGHHSEVYGLAVSSNGLFIVSADSDKAIKIWDQTEDQVFIEEEKEKKLDTLFEDQIQNEVGHKHDSSRLPFAVQENLESTFTLPSASVTNPDTIKWTERLIDTLQTVFESQSSSTNPNLNNVNVSLVLDLLKRIPSSELENTMIVLPYEYATLLLHFLSVLLEEKEKQKTSNNELSNSLNSPNTELETIMRSVFCILQVYRLQLSVDRTVRDTLVKLSDLSRDNIYTVRDLFGVNLAALRHMKRNLVSISTSSSV